MTRRLISEWPKNEPSPEPEKKKKILKGVQFRRVNKPDGTVKYESSAPDRKMVVVRRKGTPDDPLLSPPNPGNRYDVLVIMDTDPNDPMSGKYIVKIPGNPSELEGGVDAVTGEVYGSSGGASAGASVAPDVPMKTRAERERRLPLPIEVDKKTGTVLVLETELALAGGAGRELKTEKFRYFALDRRTLEIAEKVATAVELREPCLLEGETSTSKTSVIEYLAAVTGNEAIRLNLNGQTDTSELVGKFVPNDGQLQVTFEEALKNPELLSKESLDILARANKDGRALTQVESQKIAEREGMKITEWRWQDGLDICAKKEGKWLILDEINLAEPQILERLNSQLDSNPSITLSENGGQTIRELDEEELVEWQAGKLKNVYPLNNNFRIFGTMNPAEYSGRAPMSPAFKDRWTSYKNVESPHAEDYTAMMELMVYGEQPEVDIRGTKYKGGDVEPLHQTLGAVGNFRGFLPKLAKFQITLENLARKRDIGKDRKERYIFTRRGLIKFLGYLENKTLIDRQTGLRVSVLDDPRKIIINAIQYYYLDKIANADDLKKVKDQLDAVGISVDKFTHKFAIKEKSTRFPRARIFTSIKGNMVEEMVGEVGAGDWRVGDIVKFKDGAEAEQFANRARDAKKLEYVGNDKNGFMIIQLDGDRVFRISPPRANELLEKVAPAPGRAPRVPLGRLEAQKFQGLEGADITSTGQVASGSFAVGDVLTLKPESASGAARQIREATGLKVVGFGEQDEVIVQIEPSGAVIMDTENAVKRHFNIKEKSTRFPRARVFVSAQGIPIEEVVGDIGAGPWRFGDIVKFRDGAEISAVAENAEKLEYVGNSKGGFMIIQIDDGPSAFLITQSAANSELEKVASAPEIPAVGQTLEVPANPDATAGAGWPKEFTRVGGGEIKRTDELEVGGFKVGDLLKVKPGAVTFSEEVNRAKKLEVVGFTKWGHVIIQLGGDRVEIYTINIKEIFEKISPVPDAPANPDATAGAGWPKEFTGFTTGRKIERTDELARGVFGVGDLLKVRPGLSHIMEEVEQAKKLEVVGFTMDGKIMVQLDGEGVLLYEPEGAERDFEKISPASNASAWPKEFEIFIGGRKIERTDELERGEFRVGDLLKVKAGHETMFREAVNQAKKLEVVGFTKWGHVIIQLGGDKVTTLNITDIAFLEKISPVPDAPANPDAAFTTADGKYVTRADGGVSELGPLKSNGDFTVGDVLRISADSDDLKPISWSPDRDAVKKSGSFSVVGFTPNDSLVVVGLDNNKVVILRSVEAKKVFEIISPAPGALANPDTTVGTSWPKEFVALAGQTIERTDELDQGAFRVGDLLDVKPGASARPEVRQAKKLEVVGFTKGGQVIVQLDGDMVTFDMPTEIAKIFWENPPIPGAPANPDPLRQSSSEASAAAGTSWPKEFTGFNGARIKRTDALMLGAFRVGDSLRLVPGGNPLIAEKQARKFEIVGFTDEDGPRVIIQLDNGIAVVHSPERVEKTFEQAPPGTLNNPNASSF